MDAVCAATQYTKMTDLPVFANDCKIEVEESFMDIEDDTSKDLFSNCPEDIKYEILQLLEDPLSLCSMSRVCRSWNLATLDERIWKKMFFRDFLWWDKSASEKNFEDEKTWKERYGEYFCRGWQWDSANCNSRVCLSNNNFSASLSSGYTYHGVRTLKGFESGQHYFEIMIIKLDDNSRFDKGTTIYMGVGVANEKFNTENCCSGWTRENSGVGYYNDGQVYAFSERHFGKARNKVSFRAGDRIGVDFDCDNGTVQFYVNGVAVTEVIRGLKDKIYPHLILANDFKHEVIITTGKRITSSNSAPSSPAEAVSKPFEEQLATLDSMGFRNREFCVEMLMRFEGDVERVINELLSY